MRYIDTDILAKIVFDKWQECDELKHIIPAIRNVIMCASTEDVVEVVRCRDCDNWTDENGREGLCQVWSDFEISHLRYTPKDGYCSEGERKTKGD